MLAFVAYMDLRQIEDKKLRRRLVADMDRKLDELVARGVAIPEITPERLAALLLEPRAIAEHEPERNGPEISFRQR